VRCWVTSATHSRSGAGGVKLRSTRSGAGAACTRVGRTGVVVTLGLPSRGPSPHLGCPPDRINSSAEPAQSGFASRGRGFESHHLHPRRTRGKGGRDRGVRIVHVEERHPAERADLGPGDLMVTVDGPGGWRAGGRRADPAASDVR
jgi:hypothetical protein